MICSIIYQVAVWNPAVCSPQKTCKTRGIEYNTILYDVL